MNGAPYLLASESIKGKSGDTTATLIIAPPLDQEFRIASQGPSFSDGSLIALLEAQDPG